MEGSVIHCRNYQNREMKLIRSIFREGEAKFLLNFIKNAYDMNKCKLSMYALLLRSSAITYLDEVIKANSDASFKYKWFHKGFNGWCVAECPGIKFEMLREAFSHHIMVRNLSPVKSYEHDFRTYFRPTEYHEALLEGIFKRDAVDEVLHILRFNYINSDNIPFGYCNVDRHILQGAIKFFEKLSEENVNMWRELLRLSPYGAKVVTWAVAYMPGLTPEYTDLLGDRVL